MPVVCPRCGSDQVERVSALLTGRNLAAERKAAPGMLERIRLNAALHPPQQPAEPQSGLGYTLIFSLMLLALSVVLIVWGTFLHTPLGTGHAWTHDDIRNTIGGLVVLAGLLGTFGFVLSRKERRDAARSQIYRAEMLNWQKAMLLWEQMYYCHQDHGVFIPHTGWGVIHPDMIRDTFFTSHQEPSTVLH